MKTWLITGASRGLGRSFARKALDRGDRVAGSSRDPKQLQDLLEAFPGTFLPLRLDVTDAAQCDAAVAATMARFGRLDVLVNNAGYVQVGALEETTEAEARAQMETNFWGAWRMTRAVLPHFREQGGGLVVQVSSLAGIGGLPGNGMYSASKYAMEGMSESLMREAKHLGVRVLILEPASIRTDIGSSVVRSARIPAYDASVGPQRARWESGEDAHSAGNPDRCADLLLELADRDDPPLRFLMSAAGADLGALIHRERLAETLRNDADSRRCSDP